MNEIIAAAKGARGRGYLYAKMKRQETDRVHLLAKAARLQPVARARFSFTWREESKRRDPDNFCGGGRKAILDGLVAAGVLTDDGWGEIAGWSDTWEVSKTPGVLVVIEEA